jgi:hypothetical protein
MYSGDSRFHSQLGHPLSGGTSVLTADIFRHDNLTSGYFWALTVMMFRNSAFCPQSVFLCYCMDLRLKRDQPLYSVTEREDLFAARHKQYLSPIDLNL